MSRYSRFSRFSRFSRYSRSCFIRRLAPSCDRDGAASPLPAAARGPLVKRWSRRQGALPKRYEQLGWTWWVSQLLAFVVRPTPALASKVEEELAASGLGAALGRGERVLGLHVRQGDVCSGIESRRTRRRCSPLADYMREV